MDDIIQLMSWNSRGFNETKSDFISELCDRNFTIFCNQENFMLKKNSYKIDNCCGDMKFFIKPAIKDNLDKGRPKGGLFTAIPESFKSFAEDISPNNWRLQAIKFNFDESLLLINSYLPVDNRNDNSELLESLEDIRDLIDKYSPRHLLWTGDLNCDFRRQTPHVEAISDFINNFNLRFLHN